MSNGDLRLKAQETCVESVGRTPENSDCGMYSSFNY